MNEFEMKNFNFNINVNVEYDQFEILFQNTLHSSRFQPNVSKMSIFDSARSMMFNSCIVFLSNLDWKIFCA